MLAGTERWVRLFEVITSGQLAPDDEVVELVAQVRIKCCHFVFEKILSLNCFTDHFTILNPKSNVEVSTYIVTFS